MDMVGLIEKKRDGRSLEQEDIKAMIAAYTKDEIPNYQMAAWLMAVYFKGMNVEETAALTHAMLHSGEVLDLSALGSPRIDKHSTGGVGDKISLPLAAAVAACGVKVPMCAGRGLGHTGGTVDKLEAIPGYRTDLDVVEFSQVLEDVGCSIIGQTEEIAPADKRLYALRDVTGTVESIPLIAASIMSKKLAEGIEGLVLDVKVGPGAFMKTEEDAETLARTMVGLGKETGTKVIAILTRMDEPLGYMVGNACEVEESVATLEGKGPEDIVALTEVLGGAMLELGLGLSEEEGRARISEVLNNGQALSRWHAMVKAQGGQMDALPSHQGESQVLATEDGFVQAIDGREIGWIGVSLGAGRKKVSDSIDPIAGIRLEKKTGDAVKKGDCLATILHGKTAPLEEHKARLLKAFSIEEKPPIERPLIIKRIG